MRVRAVAQDFMRCRTTATVGRPRADAQTPAFSVPWIYLLYHRDAGRAAGLTARAAGARRPSPVSLLPAQERRHVEGRAEVKPRARRRRNAGDIERRSSRLAFGAAADAVSTGGDPPAAPPPAGRSSSGPPRDRQFDAGGAPRAGAATGAVGCAAARSRRTASCRPASAPPDAAGCAAGGRAPKPVAMTVIFTLPFSAGSTTAPKMMLASSSAASWTMRRRLADFDQRQVRPAGDVDDHAARAVHRRALEQRARDRAPRRFDRAVRRPSATPVPIIARPMPGHDRLDVGEIEVDQPGHQDQIRDALNRLPQHIVGRRERVGHRRRAIDDRQQPLVRES